MKYPILLLVFSTVIQLSGQIAFEENFEDKTAGLDLITEGCQLFQSASYQGTVTAVAAESNGNKFARMSASPNGAANMQMVKTIEVEPGKTYKYEVRTKGPFKRHIRVYSSSDELLSFSSDYKPTTEAEQEEWVTLELVFTSGLGTEQVKIGVYHNWSGAIDLDDFKVYETTRQTAYYLSSRSGDDDNPGTREAPWKSLHKISSTTLLPGDTVLFQRGDRFNGHFVVSGSGSEKSPVLITAFGEGEMPIISGQVGAEGGGDYEEAILVENNDNLVFDGLEVQNERLISRNGVADVDASGLQVRNSGTEIMRNLVFRNMVFKNVFAVQPILDREDFNAIQVSGLRIISHKNTEVGKEKHIRDILVEDCYFENLQRFGIQFKHSGGNEGIGNDSLNRNMNIICRNNEFYYNGGTAILPNGTYNCLIENNIFDHPGASTDPRMPGRGSSVWNIYSINTVVQYNMCLSTRGYLDSHGIHIDHSNVNTFVQYNYMEDCEGGFVEILRGNKNAVYRFNVSVNDGWREHPTWEDSNHTIWIYSSRWDEGQFDLCDSVYVYNNTVVIDRPFTTSINLDGKNMFVYNNIFSSTNGAGMGAQGSIVRTNDTPFFMSNNLFDGTVDQDWIDMDTKPQHGSPLFNGTGENQYAYQLQTGSPTINNGTAVRGPLIPGAGSGVFEHVPAYPDVDFYGNAIDLTAGSLNIGACNAKSGEVATGLSDGTLEKNSWRVYPQPAGAKIHIVLATAFSGTIQISLVNLKGQILQTDRKYLHASETAFELDVRSSIPNGIYILNLTGDGVSHSRRIVLHR